MVGFGRELAAGISGLLGRTEGVLSCPAAETRDQAAEQGPERDEVGSRNCEFATIFARGADPQPYAALKRKFEHVFVTHWVAHNHASSSAAGGGG